jgi:hypothetical protein
MHVSRRSLALLATIGGLACAPAAHAAADHNVTVTPASPTAHLTGATASGLNNGWFLTELPAAGGKAPAPTCGKDPNTMCESTLVHMTGDGGIGSGTITFRIDSFQQYSDFDLKTYESNAAGDRVKNLGSPKYDPTATSPLPVDALGSANGDYETKTVPLSDYLDGAGGPFDAYFLIQVPYFMVANDSYKLHVTLATEPFVPEEQ